MPNIKSAKKRVKIAEAHRERNKRDRSALKTVIKKADAALISGAENKAECVTAAIRKIDKSVSKGILHKNNAARKKSALMSRLNKA